MELVKQLKRYFTVYIAWPTSFASANPPIQFRKLHPHRDGKTIHPGGEQLAFDGLWMDRQEAI